MSKKKEYYICKICGTVFIHQDSFVKHSDKCYTLHRNQLIPIACKLAFGKYDPSERKNRYMRLREARMFSWYMQELSYQEGYSSWRYKCPYDNYKEYMMDYGR